MNRIVRASALLAVLVFGAWSLFAQDATGRIVGTVTDASGATVPDAKVTVVNKGTRVAKDTLTDDSGSYQVLLLPIGVYQVTAEKSGFRKVLSNGKVPLEINQTLRVDMRLEIGSVSETVTVEAEAAAVETQNATVGGSVTGRAINELPLNGRNAFDLLATQPGVTPTNADNTGQGAGYSIGGGRTDSVTFLLDGGNNNNLLNNSYVVNPNPDAIAEFRVLQSNYGAEYGRNAGGIVSVVTKSGTNKVHGSLYNYLRNDALNANDFFSNEIGAPRNVLKRNQFGGTIGGPVYLPKIFDGRNKLFFFFSYQGQRQSAVSQDGNVPVPTGLESQGNFSQSASGAPDPMVVSYLQNNPYYQQNPDLAAQGIIDPTKLNPIALNYFKKGLIPTSPTGQILSADSAKANVDDYLGRLDYTISGHDTLNATLTSHHSPLLLPFTDATGGANVPGYPSQNVVDTYFATITHTHIFSPSLVNELRFTAQRSNGTQYVPASGLASSTAQDLGITGVTPDRPSGPVLMDFLGKGTYLGFSPSGPTNLVNNTFALSNNLSWTHGRHNAKFGFYFSPYQNNTLYDYYVNGAFFFYGPGGIGSGNDFADFLMGLPDEYIQFGSAPSNIRSRSWAGYAQDEFHVTKRLTLTFGLRYEYSQPKYDTHGRSFSFIPGLQSTRFPGAPTGLVFPGDKGAPRGSNFADKNDFAPRFGFAWDVFGDGKTSLRGGAGLFYDVLKGEDNLQFNGQVPFFSFTDLSFSPADPNSGTGANYLQDPFGANGVVNPFPSKPPTSSLNFANAGFLPIGGGGVYFENPHLRTPYVLQYNLSLQRQLPGGMVGEVGWIGYGAHKLTGLVDGNPYALGTNTRIYNADQNDPTFSYLNTFQNVGKAGYNALQTSLTKRFSDRGGLGDTFFTVSYTWAHELDNISGFQQRNSGVPYYNHDYFKASGDYDLRQALSISGGWTLPFDRMWGSGPKVLTKGWSLYPIISWRTGFPLDVFAGLSTSNGNPGPAGDGQAGSVRADLTGKSVNTMNPRNWTTINGQAANYWFNPGSVSNTRILALNDQAQTDASQLNGQFTYGTLPRNAFRGPGYFNTDLSLGKHFYLFGEKLDTELRADAFNVFNHTNFATPSTAINSPTFGAISSVVGATSPTNPTGPRIVQLALHLRF
ncbi:MAG: carboxypeptidase regulatory-like domain-containing protein [Bryobacteraceae bacterium]